MSPYVTFNLHVYTCACMYLINIFPEGTVFILDWQKWLMPELPNYLLWSVPGLQGQITINFVLKWVIRDNMRSEGTFLHVRYQIHVADELGYDNDISA